MSTRRYHLTVPDGIQDVEVRIADVALQIDNRAILLPSNRRAVRVALHNLPEPIASPLRRGLVASGMAQFDEWNPEICFTGGSLTASEQETPDLPDGCWLMRFYTLPDAMINGANVEAFVGPFIIDRTHSLTEGLSLEGVVWAAANDVSLPGYVMLAVGNVPLVSEQNRPNRTKILHLQIHPDLSTLTLSPGWPVLLWNILQYRAAESPGILINNVRHGTAAVFTPSPGDRDNNTDELCITAPSGQIRTMSVGSNRVRLPADEVGVYTVLTTSGEYRFSVLPFANGVAGRFDSDSSAVRRESDLTGASSGRWGGWLDKETIESDYRNMTWLPLLIVVAILLLHLMLAVGNVRRVASQE